VEDRKSSEFRPLALPTDFLPLWRARAHSPRLVIVDPLSSFCGGPHNHQAAAKALSHLALFAPATRAALLVVLPRPASPPPPPPPPPTQPSPPPAAPSS